MHRLVERGLPGLEERGLSTDAQGPGAGPGAARDDLAASAAISAGRTRARPRAYSLLAAEHPSGLAARIGRGRFHLAAAVLQLRSRT